MISPVARWRREGSSGAIRAGLSSASRPGRQRSMGRAGRMASAGGDQAVQCLDVEFGMLGGRSRKPKQLQQSQLLDRKYSFGTVEGGTCFPTQQKTKLRSHVVHETLPLRPNPTPEAGAMIGTLRGGGRPGVTTHHGVHATGHNSIKSYY